VVAPAVSDREALAGFLHKWRERWPEWRVAEVFVAARERDVAVASFALLQELADAAWSGSDPRPGEAKLGWWAEELQGWAQGRRRHPLGWVLQPASSHWLSLAAAVPALLESREPAAQAAQAAAILTPLAAAAVRIESDLFADDAADGEASTRVAARTHAWLATQLLLQGAGAAPLQLRARLGTSDGEDAIARAWASELLATWPRARIRGRPARIFDALLQARLRRHVAGRARAQPLTPWLALRLAWRAARG
jgi:hypothetical protein